MFPFRREVEKFVCIFGLTEIVFLFHIWTPSAWVLLFGSPFSRREHVGDFIYIDWLRQ